jgi:alpha-beta hydrolase superfamily lysophospholipase
MARGRWAARLAFTLLCASALPVAAADLPTAGKYLTAGGHVLYLAPMIDESGSSLQFLTDTGVAGRLFPVPQNGFSDRSACPNWLRKRTGSAALTWQTCVVTAALHIRTPYLERTFHFTGSDGAKLAGAYWLPAHPSRTAIVLAHGADSETRAMGALIPYLLDKGFIVVALDQRGAGESEGDWQRAGIDQIADDVARAAHIVRSLTSAQSVGFYGFSQGGWVAPEAARIYGSPAFVVLKSADSETVAKNVVYEVGTAVARRFGRDAGREAGSAVEAALRALESDQPADWAAAKSAIGRIEDAPWFGLTRLPKSDSLPLPEPQKRAYRKQLIHDPSADLKALSCPVLVLLGSDDAEVNAAASASGYRRLFALSGNREAHVRVFPGAGHQLVTAPVEAKDDTSHTGTYAAGYLKALDRFLRNRLQVRDRLP